MIKKIKKNKSIKNSKKISKEVIEISISKDLSINPGLKKKDNKNLDLNKEKWTQTDKSVEEFENDYIRIIRPINDEVISIDCPECKNLLSEMEETK